MVSHLNFHLRFGKFKAWSFKNKREIVTERMNA